MFDCPNAEMRDQLPDFVHGRLSAEAHTSVAQHVASCRECEAEVALLRDALTVLRESAPALDASAIVRALPRRARPTARWRQWQMAASVLVLLGSAAAIVRIQRQAPLSPAVVADTGHTAATESTVAPTPVQAAPAATTAPSSYEDLADGEIEALIQSLDKIEATPLLGTEQHLGRSIVSGSQTGGAE